MAREESRACPFDNRELMKRIVQLENTIHKMANNMSKLQYKVEGLLGRLDPPKRVSGPISGRIATNEPNLQRRPKDTTRAWGWNVNADTGERLEEHTGEVINYEDLDISMEPTKQA